jgi:hypothetical protein
MVIVWIDDVMYVRRSVRESGRNMRMTDVTLKSRSSDEAPTSDQTRWHASPQGSRKSESCSSPRGHIRAAVADDMRA